MSDPAISVLDGYRKLVKYLIWVVAVQLAVAVVVGGVVVAANRSSESRSDTNAMRQYCIAQLNGNALGEFAAALKGEPTTPGRNSKLDEAYERAFDLSDAIRICSSGVRVPVLPRPSDPPSTTGP